MNKEAMQQLILEALSKKLGDSFHISIQKVLKTNVKLDGLTIMQDGETISPTIYLEPFYKDLENGTSLDDVVNGILRIYSEAGIQPLHFDLTSVLDFDHIKDKLYVQLVNRHSNSELLRDIPHSLFLDDFAVTVRCIVEMASEGNASFLVHNTHMEMWHMNQEALISSAIHNTRRIFGLDLRNMKDVIMELCPDFVENDNMEAPLWVLTNSRKLSGAATALFDDVLRDFANEHGNFYVIFSSVHEALLIPESDKFDASFLTRTNQVINATEVQADEILGNRAYYYSKDKGFIY